jgi:hypothetical protein
MLHEEFYDAADADLFVVSEGFEPVSELVGASTSHTTGQLCYGRHNASRVMI